MNPVDLTIVLLDLVRFTSLTNIHGDLAGADAAADLVAVTTDAIGPASSWSRPLAMAFCSEPTSPAWD